MRGDQGVQWSGHCKEVTGEIAGQGLAHGRAWLAGPGIKGGPSGGPRREWSRAVTREKRENCCSRVSGSSVVGPKGGVNKGGVI